MTKNKEQGDSVFSMTARDTHFDDMDPTKNPDMLDDDTSPMSEAGKKGGAYKHEQDRSFEEECASAAAVEYLGPSRNEILERRKRLQDQLVEHSSSSSN